MKQLELIGGYALLIIGGVLLNTASAGEYNRDEWKHWVDVDKDKQNTRQEVLIDENLASPDSTEYDEKGRIVKGLWVCAYTGDTLTTPGGLDVDHFIPLAEAHRSGGDEWYPSQKEVFANFLDRDYHLIAVTASSNRSKKDRDPAKWLPEINQCWYVNTWLKVKNEWNLDVDSLEMSAILDVLENCGCE